jgi:two-component system nitrogen regulation response regulator NtrX
MRRPSSPAPRQGEVRRAAPAGDCPLPLAGPSAAAQRARAAFAEALRVAAPVLIAADAGLDTDVVARVIHDRSRSGTPFVVLDCGASDAATLEREVFGVSPRDGGRADVEHVALSSVVLRARGGTLYLKNIVELPAAAQRRLARVVRDREVDTGRRRVAVRARVVAQAPASIDAEVGEGHFRSDLFHRLSQVRITIAGLRDRSEDIPELAARVSAELTAGRGPTFTQAALTVLAAPRWSGNLDELRRVLEKVLRAVSNGTVRQEDVLAQLPIDRTFSRMAPDVSLREARRQFERDYIASVLERHQWRMSDAARTLGIERANLYRKTRQLGISRRAGAPAAS